MSLKFWHRSPSDAENPKLPGPKGMVDQIGRVLVVNEKENPDWVWGLKCVVRKRDGGNDCYDFRVFDEKDAVRNGAAVRNYTSLDKSPQIVLFEGWYNKKTNEVEVEKRIQHPRS